MPPHEETHRILNIVWWRILGTLCPNPVQITQLLAQQGFDGYGGLSQLDDEEAIRVGIPPQFVWLITWEARQRWHVTADRTTIHPSFPQPAPQLVSQPAPQLVSQPAPQPAPQPVTWPAPQLVSQPVPGQVPQSALYPAPHHTPPPLATHGIVFVTQMYHPHLPQPVCPSQFDYCVPVNQAPPGVFTHPPQCHTYPHDWKYLPQPMSSISNT